MAKAYQCDNCGVFYPGNPEFSHTHRFAPENSTTKARNPYITSYTVYLLGDCTEIEPDELLSRPGADICYSCHVKISEHRM